MNALGGTVMDGVQVEALDELLATLGLDKATTAWVRVEPAPGGLRILAQVLATPHRATQLLVWRTP